MSIQQPHQVNLIKPFVYWSGLALLAGILGGSASAFFLIALEFVTSFRETHTQIIFLLPLAGLVIGWVYLQFGSKVEPGNNLLIDEIHDPQKIIPLRMAPLVLFGTLATHLFGGSAGREGTAIQMSGALADQMTSFFRLNREDRRILLMAGISAGFAGVFGTPLAGAVFGLEVLSIGRMRYEAIFPCFAAAITAHWTVLAIGVHHTAYSAGPIPPLTPLAFAAAIAAGVFFGVTGMLFSEGAHHIVNLFKKIAYAPLRPVLGALFVLAGVWALNTTDFLGLGIPVILRSFSEPQSFSVFALKMAFTLVTIGSGFKGGEVTPLFFIGATLGSALSAFLPLPYAVLAAMGFVAVFAGATNTPLACTLMAMEIFGSEIGVYAGIACVVSYLFSGHAGIYHSQRIGTSKSGHPAGAEGQRLSEYRAFKKSGDKTQA